MSIDPTQTGTLRYSAVTEIASTQRLTTEEAPKDEVFEAILEDGFRAYVEEMQKEKLEKMREEILQAMGLTEEDLREMPSTQRQTIEDMIATEIRQRLSAEKQLDGEKTPGRIDVADLGVETSDGGTAQTGNGLLLMLQEAEGVKTASSLFDDDTR